MGGVKYGSRATVIGISTSLEMKSCDYDGDCSRTTTIKRTLFSVPARGFVSTFNVFYWQIQFLSIMQFCNYILLL